MLLVLSLAPILNRIAFSGAALKQQFNELTNGKSQTNRDHKSDLSFLQRHNWYWRIWFKLTKNRQKKHTKVLIFTILDTSQIKKLVIVKIFTV